VGDARGRETRYQIVEACLKEVGVDPETGKRDFDVIAVGKSKSQQERIKSIRDIIRELEREQDPPTLTQL